jgi:hypothetical protein
MIKNEKTLSYDFIFSAFEREGLFIKSTETPMLSFKNNHPQKDYS